MRASLNRIRGRLATLSSGLSGLGDVASSFVVASSYAEVAGKTGRFYYDESGSLAVSTQSGKISVTDDQTVYPTGQDAIRAGGYGKLFLQNGQLWISGPLGQVQITSSRLMAPATPVPSSPTVSVTSPSPAGTSSIGIPAGPLPSPVDASVTERVLVGAGVKSAPPRASGFSTLTKGVIFAGLLYGGYRLLKALKKKGATPA